jgi:hypothetical protein
LTVKSKSHRQDEILKKVKNESSVAPSTSGIGRPHHRGDSHSSHRYEEGSRCLSKSNGSTRQKHSKEDERKKKVMGKKRSGSSLDREVHETKPKKRKRILPLFSESSDE